MYYYIFDIKKCKKRSSVENVKNYLASLGISGEFTFPSAIQTVEELVELGLSKEYTTIVAIGGDEIANLVAEKLVGRKEAMGFIPLDPISTVNRLIGTKSWKEACDILRYRKIKEIKLGKTANGSCFLTETRLDINKPINVTIEFKDYIIQARVKSFNIANFDPAIKKKGLDFLDISMVSVEPESSNILSKISSFFSKNQNDLLSHSLFHARSLRIFTKNQIPIISGNQIIAKTPQLLETTDENLRLITAKNALTFQE